MSETTAAKRCRVQKFIDNIDYYVIVLYGTVFFTIFDWIEPILLASKELKSCCVKKAMDK